MTLKKFVASGSGCILLDKKLVGYGFVRNEDNLIKRNADQTPVEGVVFDFIDGTSLVIECIDGRLSFEYDM